MVAECGRGALCAPSDDSVVLLGVETNDPEAGGFSYALPPADIAEASARTVFALWKDEVPIERLVSRSREDFIHERRARARAGAESVLASG